MRPGEAKYPHIFSPGRIGRLEAKNRIKYASTETNFNTRDGFVTDREVAYMEAQARGGAGIVTTQGAYTDPKGEGKGYVGMMAIWDDKFIPGLKRIAEVIHKYDSLACLQLMHCGRVGGVELDYCVGPSVVPQKLPIFKPPREMTREEIQACIQEHIEGARRIVEAGFDIIEISGIVGYLLSNFISKYTNKRTDEYGGDIHGRCRMMREIIEGIRKEVGPDVPIVIRLCGEELLDDRGGNTPGESLKSIQIAEAAGIDLLSVTAGWQESARSVITRDCPMGSWLYIAERMKKNIRVPVSMAYRLFVPEFPEQAIAQGKLDFWEMCRPMIADPDLPNKIAEDRQEDIIPCMACNLCLSRLFRDQPITCMVRPWVGFEGDPEWQPRPAQTKKKVMVIGGGPAGMQCAAVAAERGHDVTLYEKRGVLGGQLVAASKGPYGDGEFQRLIDYLTALCKKRGVKVVTNKEVSIQEVSAKKPDAVVLASGVRAQVPHVPGKEDVPVVSTREVMEGMASVGRRAVILGGGGTAIATAQFLAVKGGHEISIVSDAKKLGRDVNPSYIWRYMMKLKEAKVNVFTATQVKGLKKGLVVVSDPEGKEVSIPYDTLIVAVMASNNELEKPLQKVCGEVHTIGDAVGPRRTHNAMMEGYKTGLIL